jgi:hypothetical protein
MVDPDISFAIWNEHGLKSPARRLAVYQAISPANVVVVCIQETKMAVISDHVVRECMGPSFDEFFYLPAEGTCGGILLAWQSTRVSVSHPHYSTNAVTARISIGANQSWWFTGVYGHQSDVDKRAFLQELQDIHDLHVGPWMVDGDFNLIVDPADKSRGYLHHPMMARFRRSLLALELNLKGRHFTWSNEREHPTLEKLNTAFSVVD